MKNFEEFRKKSPGCFDPVTVDIFSRRVAFSFLKQKMLSRIMELDNFENERENSGKPHVGGADRFSFKFFGVI